jgi:hypothetical protein
VFSSWEQKLPYIETLPYFSVCSFKLERKVGIIPHAR